MVPLVQNGSVFPDSVRLRQSSGLVIVFSPLSLAEIHLRCKLYLLTDNQGRGRAGKKGPEYPGRGGARDGTKGLNRL